MPSNFEDVGAFHAKFDLPVSDGGAPNDQRLDDWELMSFRYKFMGEELEEFWRAALYNDHAGAADALVDLVYVAMGTAHLLNYPWQRIWDAVQQANMKKVRAAKDGADSKRGSSWDVVKPEGWQPPDIEAILTAEPKSPTLIEKGRQLLGQNVRVVLDDHVTIKGKLLSVADDGSVGTVAEDGSGWWSWPMLAIERDLDD